MCIQQCQLERLSDPGELLLLLDQEAGLRSSAYSQRRSQ